MKKFASDLWIGLRTGPARAGLAFSSLALGLFAVTILLSTLDALQRQAQGLVQSFGAGSFVLVRSAGAPEAAAWNRRQVEFLRANLAGAGCVSGVKTLPPPAGADYAVAAADAELARARGWRFVEGRALDGWDVLHGARHAMASGELCRRNGWRVGDLVSPGNEPFRIVGRFESAGAAPAGVPENALVGRPRDGEGAAYRNSGYDARQPDLEHDEALGVGPAALDAEDDLQDHRRRHRVAAQQEGGADRGAERGYYQHAPEQTAAAKTAAARRR